MKYTIKLKDGSTEDVEGKAVKLAGFEGYKFAQRKIDGVYRKGLYLIWEVSTGTKVSVATTLREAKEDAIRMLTKHKDKLIEMVSTKDNSPQTSLF